jgi:acyl-coenzyme A thioesterase PaaI-like protein
MKYPEGLDQTFDETRVRLGSAVRRLGHAVIGREVDIESMEEAIKALDVLSTNFEQGIARSREFSQFSRAHDTEVPDNTQLTSHITRPGSGPGSPHGLEMQVHRRGDRVEATFIIGSSFEGAPARSHGGIVALAFDDAMGFMLNLLKTVAYTGQLTINYKAPTPLHVPLVIHAWLGQRDGRKIFLEAELREDRPDASVIATASALFIAINAY